MIFGTSEAESAVLGQSSDFLEGLTSVKDEARLHLRSMRSESWFLARLWTLISHIKETQWHDRCQSEL